MPKIIFVSDYFADNMRRGAELANQALLHYLDNPETVESRNLHAIDSTKFYIITNFVQLSEQVKAELIKFKNYLIYEHDHKYIMTRNPFLLPDGHQNPTGKVPKDSLINVDFYGNAKMVICQTLWHQNQLDKNLDCKTDNIGGSFYLPEDLDLIEKILKSATVRKDKYCIFNDAEFITMPNGQVMRQGDNIKNKKGALKYCIDNKLPHMLIPRLNDKVNFWTTLAKFTKFVFLPDIPETCSRLLIETKMLDMQVVTNQNSGAYWEPWFKLNGVELIHEFRDKIVPNAVKLFKGYI